jgi:hypothetical protein
LRDAVHAIRSAARRLAAAGGEACARCARAFELPSPARALTALTGLIALSALGASTGCEGEALSSQPYPVRVVVHSDPGKAVAGAAVQRSGRPLASTNLAGIALVKLVGHDGDTVDLTVHCPEGFESPAKALSVRLTRPGDSSKIPEYAAACAPIFRNVVVAVRADGGARMPVTYLGKPIALTDEAGAAHILLRMHPGDQFELGLDTSAFPKHHPQNPKASFLVSANADELQRFDVRFEVERPRAIVRRAPQGPKRL